MRKKPAEVGTCASEEGEHAPLSRRFLLDQKRPGDAGEPPYASPRGIRR